MLCKMLAKSLDPPLMKRPSCVSYVYLGFFFVKALIRYIDVADGIHRPCQLIINLKVSKIKLDKKIIVGKKNNNT